MTDAKYYLLSLFLAGAVLSCGGAAAPDPAKPPPEAKSELSFRVSPAFPPRVFVSDSGVTLTMVYLQREGEAPRRALARFTGLQHPLAGHVVLISEESHSGGRNILWRLPYDGDEHTLASEELDTRDSAQISTILWLPGKRVKSNLQYDAAASRAVVPGEFFTAYREGLEDGTLAAFARLDRKAHEEKERSALKVAGLHVDRACKTHIPLEIDWEGITDEHVTAGFHCRDALRTLETVCRRDESTRVTAVRHIKKAVCSVEPKFEVNLDGSVFRVAVEPSGVAPTGAVYAYLKKRLKFTDTVVQNEAGQFLIFDPDSVANTIQYYLGDGVAMHKLIRGSHANLLWNPKGQTIVEREGAGWLARCNNHIVRFKHVSDEVRLRVLRTARFNEPKFTREEFALARDDRGIYYYVDHETERLGGKNFRVFKGPRGQVKETPLVDIVDDSDSMIFATQKGKLRLVLNKKRREEQKKPRALWISGKKQQKLVLLPLTANRELIYYGLGAYDGDEFGAICD